MPEQPARKREIGGPESRQPLYPCWSIQGHPKKCKKAQSRMAELPGQAPPKTNPALCDLGSDSMILILAWHWHPELNTLTGPAYLLSLGSSGHIREYRYHKKVHLTVETKLLISWVKVPLYFRHKRVACFFLLTGYPINSRLSTGTRHVPEK